MMPEKPTGADQKLHKEDLGVYHRVHSRAVLDHRNLYVPPFLSRAFFLFLGDFFADPSNNPVFLREWRRNVRRIDFAANHLGLAAALAVFFFLLLGIGAIILVRGVDSYDLQTLTFGLLLAVPGAIGATFAFFANVSAHASLASKAALDELAVTPVRPQEIAYGHLVGGLAPLFLCFCTTMPGIVLMAFDLCFRDPLAVSFFNGVLFTAILLFYLPFVAALSLMSGAVAQGVCFGRSDPGKALFMGLGTWIVMIVLMLGASLMGLFVGGGTPFVILFGTPLMTLLVLGTGCGFLQHLAVRLAIRQAGEEGIPR